MKLLRGGIRERASHQDIKVWITARIGLEYILLGLTQLLALINPVMVDEDANSPARVHVPIIQERLSLWTTLATVYAFNVPHPHLKIGHRYLQTSRGGFQPLRRTSCGVSRTQATPYAPFPAWKRAGQREKSAGSTARVVGCLSGGSVLSALPGIPIGTAGGPLAARAAPVAPASAKLLPVVSPPPGYSGLTDKSNRIPHVHPGSRTCAGIARETPNGGRVPSGERGGAVSP